MSSSAGLKQSIGKDLKNLEKQTFLAFRYPKAITPKDQANVMTEHDKAVLKHFSIAYGDDMHTIIPLNNHNKESFGGHAQVLHPQSKISPLTLPANNMFGNFVMIRIRNNELSDEKIRETFKSNLIDAIDDETTLYDHPSIQSHYSTEHPGFDKAQWSSSLNGGDVTAYSLKGQHGSKLYFLGVNSNVGEHITGELRSIAAEDGMTATKFVNDPRVIWANNLSQRNAKRLLAIGSQILTSHEYLKTLNIVDDMCANTTKHQMAPKLVEPNIRSSYNTVAAIQGNKLPSEEPEAVVFYNGCANGADNKISALIRGDYLSPVYEFQGKSIDIGNNSYHHPGNITNRFYNVVPAFSSSNYESNRENAIKNINASVIETLNNNIYSLEGNDIAQSHFATHRPVDVKHVQSNVVNYGLDSNIPYRKYSPVYGIVE